MLLFLMYSIYGEERCLNYLFEQSNPQLLFLVQTYSFKGLINIELEIQVTISRVDRIFFVLIIEKTNYLYYIVKR